MPVHKMKEKKGSTGFQIKEVLSLGHLFFWCLWDNHKDMSSRLLDIWVCNSGGEMGPGDFH